MRVVLPYGRAQIEAEIPDANLMGIAVPRSPINPAIDEAVEVERALHNPIGSPRLRDLARGRRNATIIVSDHTRPTPSGKLVPPLLEELEAAGIPAANVVVVFATGSHRPTRLEEMRSIFGEKTCSRVRVLSHECDAQDHVYMGETGINHTPVWVNRVVAESDIRISVSTVEPHQGAGWSGGAKNLLPGVCSRETIMRHHALYSHPGTCIGAVKGNPFREDLEQAASLVGLDFVVQVILSQKKQISRVFAGHWIEAHRDAVRVASDLLNYQLPEMADIVLASVGGTPRDSNLWQVEGKGLTRVGSAVRQGGVIIMVAECCEGVGHLELGRCSSEGCSGRNPREVRRG